MAVGVRGGFMGYRIRLDCVLLLPRLRIPHIEPALFFGRLHRRIHDFLDTGAVEEGWHARPLVHDRIDELEILVVAKTEQRIALARMKWDYPDVSRGKYFRVEGQLIEIYTERINVEGPDLPKFCYLGVLKDRVTGGAVHFYTPTMPKRRASPTKWDTSNSGHPQAC